MKNTPRSLLDLRWANMTKAERKEHGRTGGKKKSVAKGKVPKRSK